MDKVTVKATREDNRVAFFEQHPDHEGGEVLITGSGKPVTATKTRGLLAAITAGRLVETQETPTASQTPPTRTGGVPAKGGAPWEGYDDATVDEVVAHLPDLDEAGRERVLTYEKANKKRAGVIQPLVNWNS